MRRDRLGAIAVGLAAMLALAGCRLDAEVEAVLDEDGGGELLLSIAVDEALAGEATAAGLDPVAAIASTGRELEDWQVDVGDEGRAVTLAGRFAGPEELEAAVAELSTALAQPELVPLDPLAITVGEDAITLTGGASLAPTSAVRDIGYTPAEAVAELERSVDYRLAVTMPAAVRSHEGGVVDGRRVVWEVPAGEEVPVVVVGERPTGPPLGWIAAAAAAVGALLLATALVLRRR